MTPSFTINATSDVEYRIKEDVVNVVITLQNFTLFLSHLLLGLAQNIESKDFANKNIDHVIAYRSTNRTGLAGHIC